MMNSGKNVNTTCANRFISNVLVAAEREITHKGDDEVDAKRARRENKTKRATSNKHKIDPTTPLAPPRNKSKGKEGKKNKMNVDLREDDSILFYAGENWDTLVDAEIDLKNEDTSKVERNWTKLVYPYGAKNWDKLLSTKGDPCIESSGTADKNWNKLLNTNGEPRRESSGTAEKNWNNLVNTKEEPRRESSGTAEKNCNYLVNTKEEPRRESSGTAEENWNNLVNGKKEPRRESSGTAEKNWNNLLNTKGEPCRESTGTAEKNWNNLVNSRSNLSKIERSMAERNWSELIDTNVSKESTSKADGNWDKLMATNTSEERTRSMEYRIRDIYGEDDSRSLIESITSVSASSGTEDEASECAAGRNKSIYDIDDTTISRIESVTTGMESLWKEIGGLKSSQICQRSEYRTMKDRLTTVEKDTALQKEEVNESLHRLEKMYNRKCTLCKTTANEISIVRYEQTAQKEDFLNALRRLEKMNTSKCSVCTSTAHELVEVKNELASQKNEHLNSIKKLKERYDDTKCKECTSTIRELEKVKSELASQKERVLNLGRSGELSRELYGSKCDACSSAGTSPRLHHAQRIRNVSDIQYSTCKSNIRELSQFADKVEDKLSKLKLAVQSTDDVSEPCNNMSLNSPTPRISKHYDGIAGEKTAEKLCQLKEEIDDMAGNLEWYSSRDVEKKDKFWDDIPHEQNRIQAALQRSFSRENSRESTHGSPKLPRMSITSR